MIKLLLDEYNDVINTTWLVKINKNIKTRTSKNGQEKKYASYIVTFPQEIYEFLEIKNQTLYIAKEHNSYDELILTTEKPDFLTPYKKIKLYNRRKNNTEGRVPTTSFILPKKLFNNLEQSEYLQLKLHPTLNDNFRNKRGKITIKALNS